MLDKTRTNGRIRAREVRLINENGDLLGVMSPEQAMEHSRRAGLDLVEISPNAKPPVCKIMDYGKYKYQQQKKAAEAKKKQKVVEVKELKFRPNIEDHDYQTKMRKAHQFLGEGNKVKFTMRYRGREMAHKEIGTQVLNRIKEELAEIGKVEMHPKFEGRQVTMVVGPLAQKS